MYNYFMIAGKNKIDYSKTNATHLEIEAINSVCNIPDGTSKTSIYKIQVSSPYMVNFLEKIQVGQTVIVKGRVEISPEGNNILVAERIITG